ncbi:response regulator [Paenibacillus sp. JDR-2]|uniref:response regulator n=1 Tax=Paenibacillus sp. (strain JDR-2) TaxID=324057 RepID=UPI000166B1D1|nr:response regulator [Paenibacillus sp. JDR-2]ACS99564.1 response regulator receiver and SARP domain protein [Paenibacillus sp. JDR-2]
MMRAIVVDDERLVAEQIDRMLVNAGVKVLGRCVNPHEALGMAKALQPDVLFLDIEMPELSGLEIAQQVYADKLDTEVVFITAYNQYAIDAFRVNALDYLLKPVMEEDLQRSLERIEKRRQHRGAVSSGGQRMVNVELFGKFALRLEDSPDPIRWVTSKCAELLAYMLLQTLEKEISKWELFEALWPALNEEKAGINLRSTVSRINKTLRDYGAGMTLASVRNGYRLVLSDEAPTVDAAELELFVLDGVEPDTDNVSHVEQLFHRCSQPFLQEFDSAWCEPYRKQYRQYFLHLGKKLLIYYEKTDAEPFKALRLADLLVEHEPYDESLREAALKLHHRTGGTASAAAYYEAYADLINTELGALPGVRLTALLRGITD